MQGGVRNVSDVDGRVCKAPFELGDQPSVAVRLSASARSEPLFRLSGLVQHRAEARASFDALGPFRKVSSTPNSARARSTSPTSKKMLARLDEAAPTASFVRGRGRGCRLLVQLCADRAGSAPARELRSTFELSGNCLVDASRSAPEVPSSLLLRLGCLGKQTVALLMLVGAVRLEDRACDQRVTNPNRSRSSVTSSASTAGARASVGSWMPALSNVVRLGSAERAARRRTLRVGVGRADTLARIRAGSDPARLPDGDSEARQARARAADCRERRR